MDPETRLVIDVRRLGYAALVTETLSPVEVAHALMSCALGLTYTTKEFPEVVQFMKNIMDDLDPDEFAAQIRAILRKEQRNDVPN